MTSSGFRARARAMHTRWRWPPENWWGKFRSIDCSRPTNSNSSPTRSLAASPVAIPCTLSGSATAVPTRTRGSRLANGSWKTICMVFRCGRISRGPRSVMSRPLSRTRPSSGWWSRMMRLASVDLPQPLSPTTASVSPWSMWSETFITACTRAWPSVGNCLETPSTRTSGSTVFTAGSRPGGMPRVHPCRPCCPAGVPR